MSSIASQVSTFTDKTPVVTPSSPSGPLILSASAIKKEFAEIKKEIEELLLKLPKGKSANFLLTVSVTDGRGDIEHLKADALKIKKMFPPIKLYAYIELMLYANPDSLKITLAFLKKHKGLFADVRVIFDKLTLPMAARLKTHMFEAIRTGKNPYAGVKEMLVTWVHSTAETQQIAKINDTFGSTITELQSYATTITTAPSIRTLYQEINYIINISREILRSNPIFNNMRLLENEAIHDWLAEKEIANFPSLTLWEYGASSGKAEGDGPITGHVDDIPPLGMHGDNGMRIVEEFEGEITDEKRAEKLLSISNPEFLQTLIMSKSPTLNDVTQYLKTRIFAPGFIQGDFACAFFIRIVIESHINKTSDKFNFGHLTGIDFHLPKKFINIPILTVLLDQCGIKKQDWIIMDESNTKKQADTKAIPAIRFFTTYFEDDEDYKALYYFSNFMAGSSGDDTLTTVLSSSSISSFLCCTSGQSMKVSFLMRLAKAANLLDCKKLYEYFNLFINDPAFQQAWVINSKQDGNFISSFSEKENADILNAQKAFIQSQAKRLGSFLSLNKAALLEEIKIYRNYLFTQGNIFLAFPGLLLPGVKNALKYYQTTSVAVPDKKTMDDKTNTAAASTVPAGGTPITHAANLAAATKQGHTDPAAASHSTAQANTPPTQNLNSSKLERYF